MRQSNCSYIPVLFQRDGHPHFGGMRLLAGVAVLFLIIGLDRPVQAQPANEKETKDEATQVYPYALSIDPGVALVGENGKFTLPVLHFRSVANAKPRVVLVRAAWNTKTERTECNAGTEPITLAGPTGALQPEAWGDSLGLLLSAFGVQGSGDMSFALFDFEMMQAKGDKTNREAARLSEWVKVPARLK